MQAPSIVCPSGKESTVILAMCPSLTQGPTHVQGRKVALGRATLDLALADVVHHRRLFGGVKRAQPPAGAMGQPWRSKMTELLLTTQSGLRGLCGCVKRAAAPARPQHGGSRTSNSRARLKCSMCPASPAAPVPKQHLYTKTQVAEQPLLTLARRCAGCVFRLHRNPRGACAHQCRPLSWPPAAAAAAGRRLSPPPLRGRQLWARQSPPAAAPWECERWVCRHHREVCRCRGVCGHPWECEQQ